MSIWTPQQPSCPSVLLSPTPAVRREDAQYLTTPYDRLCQNVATCSNVMAPVDNSRIPYIKQKVDGLRYSWAEVRAVLAL